VNDANLRHELLVSHDDAGDGELSPGLPGLNHFALEFRKPEVIANAFASRLLLARQLDIKMPILIRIIVVAHL
jgi:hypothetical protein